MLSFVLYDLNTTAPHDVLTYNKVAHTFHFQVAALYSAERNTYF